MKSWTTACVYFAIAVGVVYALVWHPNHLGQIAALSLVLFCPLMHLLMHRGHNREGHRH